VSAYRDDATGLEARQADARAAWDSAAEDALAKGQEGFLAVIGSRAVCMAMAILEVAFAVLVVRSWVGATSHCLVGRGVDRGIHCGGLVIIAKMLLVPFIVIAAIALYALASRHVRHVARPLGARRLRRILAAPTTLDALERDAPATRLARARHAFEISRHAWQMTALALVVIDGLLYVGLFLPDGDDVFATAVRPAVLAILVLIECLLLLLRRRVSNLVAMLATVPFVALAGVASGLFGLIAVGLCAAGLANAVSARPRR
jgi:hypothetical protein